MPSKKRKYNARFPAGRIKRIMQADEEVGKIAAPVPIIISRTLELFVESLLLKASQITSHRNAKKLTPAHLKECINSENRFDFLKDLVATIEEGCFSSEQSEEGPVRIDTPAANNFDSSKICLLRSQSLQATNSQTHYHQLQNQQTFNLNNYTNSSHKPASVKMSRMNSTPSSTITSSRQPEASVGQDQVDASTFPIKISYNLDNNLDSSIESPTIKIDYSKFTLPASALTPGTTSTSNIDLTQFNQQVTNSSLADEDEDYDN